MKSCCQAFGRGRLRSCLWTKHWLSTRRKSCKSVNVSYVFFFTETVLCVGRGLSWIVRRCWFGGWKVLCPQCKEWDAHYHRPSGKDSDQHTEVLPRFVQNYWSPRLLQVPLIYCKKLRKGQLIDFFYRFVFSCR